MTSAIPSTIYNQIVQTNSSPKTTAALLNEAENTYSSEPLHYNAKRRYPFWKVCQNCGQVFACETMVKAERNKTCSRKCAGKLASRATIGKHRKPPVMLTCQTCGKVYERKNGKATKFCSRKCYGQWRSENPGIRQHMAEIADKGRAGWTDESMASYLENMSGPNNPAWKGGVTYFKTHGNYQGVKYVRCPPEFLPMARKDHYVMEHRLIVARHLGRCLKRSEVVHHKDHDPTNNDPANLMLFSSNTAHKRYEGRGQPAPLWQL